MAHGGDSARPALERIAAMSTKIDEIADGIKFFLSPQSNYVTGQVLSVSGGLTMAD